MGVNVEDYIGSYESLAQYAGRDTAEVLGAVARVEFITPDGYQSAVVLFNEKPTFVKAILTDSEALEDDDTVGDAAEYDAELESEDWRSPLPITHCNSMYRGYPFAGVASSFSIYFYSL